MSLKSSWGVFVNSVPLPSIAKRLVDNRIKGRPFCPYSVLKCHTPVFLKGLAVALIGSAVKVTFSLCSIRVSSSPHCRCRFHWYFLINIAKCVRVCFLENLTCSIQLVLLLGFTFSLARIVTLSSLYYLALGFLLCFRGMLSETIFLRSFLPQSVFPLVCIFPSFFFYLISLASFYSLVVTTYIYINLHLRTSGKAS